MGLLKNILKVVSSNNAQSAAKIEEFDIMGMAYMKNNIASIMKKNRPDYSDFVYRLREDNVMLVPEPQNKHDRNAIAVYMDDIKIGYVPADMTADIRPYIGKYDFIATITGGDKRSSQGIIEKNFHGNVRIENK